MSTVLRLLKRGSGPTRVRAWLRKGTHAVRQAAALLRAQHAQTIRLAQSTLPASVMGGDLLSLMSDPLRLLLQAEELAQAAPEPEAGSRPLLEAPANRRERRATLPGLNGPIERRTSDRATWSAGPNGRDRPSIPPVGAQTAMHGQSGPYLDPARPVQFDSSPSAGQVSHSTRTEGANGSLAGWHSSTTLEYELAEYFRPATIDSSPAEPPGRPPRLSHPNPSDDPVMPRHGSVPNLPTGATPEPLNMPGWQALSGQQLAERLHAFASGETRTAVGGPVTTTEGSRVEVNNTFHIQVDSARESVPPTFQELSDQVAEILRRQAIQHGIDIT